MCFYVGDVDELFSALPQSIDTLYLLFSDPWPKVRHEKRRLTTLTRLLMYHNHRVEHLILKTDNMDFYHYSLAQLQASPFQIVNHCELVTESAIPTEFEDKYRKLGKPIYFIEAKR
jgi:Predicted S-adenosylmethionine-dependent methyltransferase